MKRLFREVVDMFGLLHDTEPGNCRKKLPTDSACEVECDERKPMPHQSLEVSLVAVARLRTPHPKAVQWDFYIEPSIIRHRISDVLQRADGIGKVLEHLSDDDKVCLFITQFSERRYVLDTSR